MGLDSAPLCTFMNNWDILVSRFLFLIFPQNKTNTSFSYVKEGSKRFTFKKKQGKKSSDLQYFLHLVNTGELLVVDFLYSLHC